MGIENFLYIENVTTYGIMLESYDIHETLVKDRTKRSKVIKHRGLYYTNVHKKLQTKIVCAISVYASQMQFTSFR